MTGRQIHVAVDGEALGAIAVTLFTETAQQAIASRGRFIVSLAGGTTPKRLYKLLAERPARDQIEWGKVVVFFGDERCVPPDDDRSNFRMAYENLIDHVPIDRDNIFRIRGEIPAADAAEDYENQLRLFFGDLQPRLDLALLGLGDDCHTASMFPGRPWISETRWAAAVFVPGHPFGRVTLTPAIFNLARRAAFLVEGEGKREAVYRVLHGPMDPVNVPAQCIAPEGDLHWLLDEAASRTSV